MECIEWQGATSSGYGKVWVGGRTVRVHRHMYALIHGPIPAGVVIRHTCDNRRCLNPMHLVAGSQGDNIRDCVERGRHPNAAKTTCPKGHPYSEGWAFTRKGGGINRVCRLCYNDRKGK